MKKPRIPLIIFITLFIFTAAFYKIHSYEGFVRIIGKTRYWSYTKFIKNQTVKNGETMFYLDEDGYLREGWYKTKDGYLYLEGGIPVTGESEISGNRYFFDERGCRQSGIVDTGNGIFYYNESSGILSSGFVCPYEDKDGTFYFSEDEGMVKGWQIIDANHYFFGDNGLMYTGWHKIEGESYYFEKAGPMATGWKWIDNDLYCFRSDGRMMHNTWYADMSGTYYLDGKGHAASGVTEIYGETCLFSDEYRLLHDEWTGNHYADSDGHMVQEACIDGLWIDSDGNKIYNGIYGTGGSLYIPSVGIDVPAYLTYGGDIGQYITDQENSATYLTSYPMPVIADHNYQGFENIKSCVPGETVSFLLTEDSVEEYICTDKFTGINTGYDLLDERNVSIAEYDTDMVLYTCNENWQHITLVLFRKI